MTLLPLTPVEDEKAYVKESGPASRVTRFEVGDTKQPTQFYPQFKTIHWGNECNLSVRLTDADYASATVQQTPQGIEWVNGIRTARFYETTPDVGAEDGGFEFELEFASRPDSNVIPFTITTKGFDFFYQPPLTEEEIKAGDVRPENVVGSYAVYHATQRNSYVGGQDYRTGKAFHLYRPWAEDAKGTRVWCDLAIDVNAATLTITMPQDFLDAAVYPVLIDPTYGYTSLGGTTDGTDGSAVAYSAGSFGGTNNSTIVSGAWYGNIASGTASPTVNMGLYSTAANVPVTLLASIFGVCALTTTPTPFTLSDSDTFAIQNGTTYAIAACSDYGSGWRNLYDTGGVRDSYTSFNDFLTSPWVESGSSGDRLYSFYFNLTSPGGGTFGRLVGGTLAGGLLVGGLLSGA